MQPPWMWMTASETVWSRIVFQCEDQSLDRAGGDASAGGGIQIDAGTVELEDLVLRNNNGFAGRRYGDFGRGGGAHGGHPHPYRDPLRRSRRRGVSGGRDGGEVHRGIGRELRSICMRRNRGSRRENVGRGHSASRVTSPSITRPPGGRSRNLRRNSRVFHHT